jgi:methionyl-tRNA formyltransferase
MHQKSVKLRTIFMGTSEFANTILVALIENDYNLIGVYTQPDKKVGRKQVLEKTAVKITAEKYNIPVFSPSKLNEEEIAKLKEQAPDLLIVAAYGKILPESILKLPGFGAINVHASLLPKYRGPAPIQNAILNGEKQSGVTLMLMDAGIDTGEIISQQTTTIGNDETTVELSQKLSTLSIELLLKNMPLWIERKIKSTPQNEKQATLCQLIERTDGKIIWSDSAQSIYNRYRAFFAWPGIFTYWEKDDSILRIKLNKITFSDTNPAEKKHLGEVFQLEEKIAIQTGKGLIFPQEIQKEGKGNLNIKEFINGNTDFIGNVLK